MKSRLSSLISRPALLQTLASQARLGLRLVREPNVPAWLKAILALPLLYVISPLDVLPDVIPVIGQLDDLGVILLALEVLTRFSPPEVVTFHREAIRQGRPYAPIPATGIVIDAQFRRE